MEAHEPSPLEIGARTDGRTRRWTTIQVDSEVRDELRSRGQMGESYNDVLRRLLRATRLPPPGRRDATSSWSVEGSLHHPRA